MVGHVPQALALALGADEPPPEGLSPCALLCDLLGPSSGQDRWLSLVGEATRLAEAQCSEGEIVAAVARSLDMALPLASACVAAMADALSCARLAAQASLRERLWAYANGERTMTKDAAALLLSAARQYLAWEGGHDAKVLATAIRQAESAGARAKT